MIQEKRKKRRGKEMQTKNIHQKNTAEKQVKLVIELFAIWQREKACNMEALHIEGKSGSVWVWGDHWCGSLNGMRRASLQGSGRVSKP